MEDKGPPTIYLSPPPPIYRIRVDCAIEMFDTERAVDLNILCLLNYEGDCGHKKDANLSPWLLEREREREREGMMERNMFRRL